MVMFIHREEAYHTNEEARELGIAGIGDLSVAKQRNGPTGVIQLIWREQYTRFENLSREQHEEFAAHGEYLDEGGQDF